MDIITWPSSHLLDAVVIKPVFAPWTTGLCMAPATGAAAPPAGHLKKADFLDNTKEPFLDVFFSALVRAE